MFPPLTLSTCGPPAFIAGSSTRQRPSLPAVASLDLVRERFAFGVKLPSSSRSCFFNAAISLAWAWRSLPITVRRYRSTAEGVWAFFFNAAISFAWAWRSLLITVRRFRSTAEGVGTLFFDASISFAWVLRSLPITDRRYRSTVECCWTLFPLALSASLDVSCEFYLSLAHLAQQSLLAGASHSIAGNERGNV